MKIIEVEGPIIVDAKLAKELGVPTIIMPEDSIVSDKLLNSERRICRGCGYGFYWPPIMGFGDTVRHEDLCLSCEKPNHSEPDNPCTLEDMLEISS
jgi:hypothetical protein